MPNTIADPVRITPGGTITELQVGLSLGEGDTIASIDNVTITPSIADLTVTNAEVNLEEAIIGGETFGISQSLIYDLTFDGSVYGGAIAATIDFTWTSVGGDTLTDTVDVELRRALNTSFSNVPGITVAGSGNAGDVSDIQVRLVSDHTNAETDLDITPNSASNRSTLLADPGVSIRASNTTKLNSYFNSINSAPSVHKVLRFPNGSFAFNTLDPAAYEVAFKNFTMTGSRPEYAAQHIETGTGTPEWGSRIDCYNTSDTDYWIDIPGSWDDKGLRPSMVNIQNLVFNLGDANAGIGSGDYSSCLGGVLRIGDRVRTGKRVSQYTPSRSYADDLARGVFLSGCYFTDVRVSKSNPTYQYLPQQADGTHTIYTNGMALVEMNRVYDLCVDKCAFRGGLGPQLWLTTCDRPLVIGSRHFLAYIGIQNACTHSFPTDGYYYRDFMDCDGVPGSYMGCYVEQPALAGILASGGMWSDMRIEGGYLNSYPNRYGPGYYPMPASSTWTINFSNLAGDDPAANEEQYIQFASLPASIVPYAGASSRAPTIADYIQPGMVLKLQPTSPATYGVAQRPTTNLLVTAVDAVNDRVYFYGGYRANNLTGIGVAMLGKPTTGGVPIEVMSGTGAGCIRMVGIPAVGAGSRIGWFNNSVMINATPGSDDPVQPLPVPRMAMSFDRTVFSVSGIVGNNGSHTPEEDRDSFRPVICTTNWGGAVQQGAGVAFQGCLPPESPHAKIYGSGELEDWPRSYADRTNCDTEAFDFFTSVDHQYILGDDNWMLQFTPIECPDTGQTVFTYDTSTTAWQAFDGLPADAYHYTARVYSPIALGSAQASGITASGGKVLLTFPTAHSFYVDQVVDVGNTGIGGYNTAHTITAVPSATTILTNIDWTQNVTATINVTIQNADRFALNYRIGSGDSVGTTLLWPPTGIDFTAVPQGWSTIRGEFPAGTTDVYVYAGAKKHYKVAWIGLEAKSTEVDVLTAGSYTLTDTVLLKKSVELDSSGGAITATVPDGWHAGQEMTITMTDATNASTVLVTNHEDGTPETLTFNAVNETAVIKWTASRWISLYKSPTV